MSKPKKHLSDRVTVYATIWCLSFIGSLFALRIPSLPKEAGIMLTIVTVLAFGLFIYKYYRSIFFMDEVEIKIQMEAVVVAFSIGLTVLITLSLLELFVNLDKADWSYRHLVPLFVLAYFIGLFISKRKYHSDNEKYD